MFTWFICLCLSTLMAWLKNVRTNVMLGIDLFRQQRLHYVHLSVIFSMQLGYVVRPTVLAVHHTRYTSSSVWPLRSHRSLLNDTDDTIGTLNAISHTLSNILKFGAVNKWINDLIVLSWACPLQAAVITDIALSVGLELSLPQLRLHTIHQ